jgi:hypothetical protein
MGLRCTGRVPTEEDLRILEEALDGFLERYRNDPEDAQRLLSVGETTLPPSIDPVEGAAWTMMANVFLSLDATLVRS